MDKITLALIELARREPNGFDQESAVAHLESVVGPTSLNDIAKAISDLTGVGRLLAFRTDQNAYRWRLETEERYQKLQGLNSTERVVYDNIERTSNKGIWIKDLRRQTNLYGTSDLDHALKVLVQRKLIKSEESIAGKNKKVYMLYELTPAVEVTGGVWYTQKTKDVDLEFITNITHALFLIIQRTGPVTATFLEDYLERTNVAKIQITAADLSVLLQTLVHDGILEYATIHDITLPELKLSYTQKYLSSEHNRGNPFSSISQPFLSTGMTAPALSSVPNSNANPIGGQQIIPHTNSQNNLPPGHGASYAYPEPIYKLPLVKDIEAIGLSAFTSPCTSCPLFDSCGSGNVIEPETCEYFTQWLASGDVPVQEWTAALSVAGASGTTASSHGNVNHHHNNME